MVTVSLPGSTSASSRVVKREVDVGSSILGRRGPFCAFRGTVSLQIVSDGLSISLGICSLGHLANTVEVTMFRCTRGLENLPCGSRIISVYLCDGRGSDFFGGRLSVVLLRSRFASELLYRFGH